MKNDQGQEVGERSGREPTEPQGPRRRAPQYYVGETYGRHKINYPDAQRYPNGALPGIRNKAARRIKRAALGRVFSTLEQKFLKARGVPRDRRLVGQRPRSAAQPEEGARAAQADAQPATRSGYRAKTRKERSKSKRIDRMRLVGRQHAELRFVRNLVASLEVLRAAR